MDRSVNSGRAIEAPRELRLIYAPVDDSDASTLRFETLIADRLRSAGSDINADLILSYDLFTYAPDPAAHFGAGDAFYRSSRIDDLAMVHAGLESLIASDSEPFEGLSLLLIFSNEEIGSLTLQGARSGIIHDVINALCEAEDIDRSERLALYQKSIAISADQAHALHPNYSDYHAQGTRPKLNGGPVIKYELRSYGTDARAAAYFEACCHSASVPYQVFTNRSDLVGGSAIGPLLFPQLPISVVDLGNPQWAMHSLYESAGSYDQAYTIAACRRFFESNGIDFA